MNSERASALAQECGFEIVGPLDVSALLFRQDVRDMCSPDMCPQGFKKSWSCPPAVPEVKELQDRASKYSQGIIVQTVGHLEDPFDFETVLETTQEHGRAFSRLAEKLADETHGASLSMGAGPCPLCSPCSYPDSPCRFPEKMIISMEASGLLVNDVCIDNGLLYNNGEKTVTFTSCCLF